MVIRLRLPCSHGSNYIIVSLSVIVTKSELRGMLVSRASDSSCVVAVAAAAAAGVYSAVYVRPLDSNSDYFVSTEMGKNFNTLMATKSLLR